MAITYALYKSEEDWIIALINIEVAFLEGKIGTLMHMEWPEAMAKLGFISKEERKEYVIKLVEVCMATAMWHFTSSVSTRTI